MKKKASRIILMALVALAVLIVVAVAFVRAFNSATVDPHAGHDHASGEPHTTITTANIKPSESYTLTENKDGTFSFQVKNVYGKVMYAEKNLKQKPVFTEVNDAILEISHISKANPLTGWAVYCNIRSMDRTPRITKVLGTANGRVAYLDYISEKWVVFVTNPFDQNDNFQGFELPDLTIQEGGNPKLSCEKTKSGDLKVTYATADGNKTVTVEMGA